MLKCGLTICVRPTYSLIMAYCQVLQKHAIKRLPSLVYLISRVCRTMVTQLIQHERIETTLPKAKELSRYADSCITLAKKV